jgi:hypothetical protein
VSFDGGGIQFALPHPFEQALSISVEFDGAKLKATLHYLKAEAGLGDFGMEVAAGAEGP